MPNLYPFVGEMKNMLQNLDRWLDAAAEHANGRSIDVDQFATARLALDQYPLVRQVQSACDSAKYAAARLAGKEAPAHADDEKTFADLRTRISKVTSYLETFSEKDFEGAETRKVALPFLPGGKKGALGLDYFVHFAQPNFFFHIAHAYAILRHNGVKLGKLDYIGPGIPLLDL
jgi:uncharacterized protein